MRVAPIGRNDVLFAFKALTLVEGLSDSARRVGGAIIDAYNRDTGQCDPSVERLVDYLGINKATVLRAIDRLHELDLIQRVSHGSRTHRNAYLPNWAKFNHLVAEWDAKKRAGNGPFEGEIEGREHLETAPAKVAEMRP